MQDIKHRKYLFQSNMVPKNILIVIGPFLQTSLPATLYNPSDSQHGYFSLEDGDSMLLQNVGFY
jgi:hypothetical protein